MSQPTLRLFDGYHHTTPELRPKVRFLQKILKQQKSNIRIDGLFGEGTEILVREFQRENKLPEDGVVGPMTWAVLLGQAPESPGKLDLSTSYMRNDRSMLKQLELAENYRQIIQQGEKICQLSESVIAAIGSRESGWGLYLEPKGPSGTGDRTKRGPSAGLPRIGSLPPDGGGFGRGLMQIDYDFHNFAREDLWRDPELNIKYGCKIMADSGRLLSKRTDLKGLDLISATLASYNCGAGRVLIAYKQGRPLDYFTTGRDYSEDVLNRAGFFQLHGWA